MPQEARQPAPAPQAQGGRSATGPGEEGPTGLEQRVPRGHRQDGPVHRPGDEETAGRQGDQDEEDDGGYRLHEGRPNEAGLMRGLTNGFSCLFERIFRGSTRKKHVTWFYKEMKIHKH